MATKSFDIRDILAVSTGTFATITGCCSMVVHDEFNNWLVQRDPNIQTVDYFNTIRELWPLFVEETDYVQILQ